MRKVSQPISSSVTPDSPPVGRRERRRAEVRERLFRAALRLFAKKGFAETTCEDITNAADVGKGTFFNYFPSKDHILAAFAEMQLHKLRAFVEEARRLSKPAPELLKALSRRMTEEPGRNPEIVRVLLLANLACAPVRAEMAVNQAQMLELLIELIRMGQRRGEIRDDRPAREIAQVFRQLIFGTLMHWSLHAEVPLRNRIDSAFQLLCSGIAAPIEKGQPSRKMKERGPC